MRACERVHPIPSVEETENSEGKSDSKSYEENTNTLNDIKYSK